MSLPSQVKDLFRSRKGPLAYPCAIDPAQRPGLPAGARRPVPGRRGTKQASGKARTGVRAKPGGLHGELTGGVVTNAASPGAHGIGDLLADGLAGRAPKKVSPQREVLEP